VSKMDVNRNGRSRQVGSYASRRLPNVSSPKGLFVALAAASAAIAAAQAPPGYTATTVPTCCGHTCPAFTLNAGQDWTLTQANTLTTNLTTKYKKHVYVVSGPTRTYNCHGFVFGGSSVWINDPSPFLGPKAPCWKAVKKGGTVARWGTTVHSAYRAKEMGGSKPSSLPYYGKLGANCLAYHDNAVYGGPGWMWSPQ